MPAESLVVLHHYLRQSENLNVSMPLNSYITHPTGAGSRDLLAHMGVLQDLGYYLWESSTSFGRSAYCNYCEIRNGNCNCLTIIHEKKMFYSLSPPPAACRLPGHIGPPPPTPLPPTLFLASPSLLLLTENKNHIIKKNLTLL